MTMGEGSCFVGSRTAVSGHRLCRALSQSVRLDVFRLLVREGAGGLPTGEIAARLDVRQNTMSAHLSVHAHSGLVTSERFGRGDPGEAEELLAAMEMPARDLLRREGTPYDELGLDDPSLTEDQILDAMMAQPILIRRPIVVTDRGTRLCRPPETVLEILGDR